MDADTADRLAKASRRNQPHLKPGSSCGCFHCLSTFAADAIRDWVDDGLTALCPVCGIDSVVAGVTDSETLRALQTRQFGPENAVRPTPSEWDAALAAHSRAPVVRVR